MPGPRSCEAWLFEHGQVVFETEALPADAFDVWVRCVAHLSGQRVDWHYDGDRAVVRAAVIYVLRCLVAERIPLNGGCLAPVAIEIPAGSLLDPESESRNFETTGRRPWLYFTRFHYEECRNVPNRDLVIVFSGDEETEQATIQSLAADHRDLIDAEYALNFDGGPRIA